MRFLVTIVLVATLLVATVGPAAAQTGDTWSPPPVDADFDYQIGGPYRVPSGVTVVSRDWYGGRPLRNGYSICYINAFQTQPDLAGVDRPDERSNWPAHLVLDHLGDPNWPGEYLIDISTPAKRQAARDHVALMIRQCAAKGFDAVEFDNLDSWTRFRGTALADQVPFGRRQTIMFARLITRYAHQQGLAVGQKNTASFGRKVSLRRIGFDFAIAESCGVWNECGRYTRVFGDNVIAIEYSTWGFANACAAIGSRASVVLRDVAVSRRGSPSYVYDSC